MNRHPGIRRLRVVGISVLWWRIAGHKRRWWWCRVVYNWWGWSWCSEARVGGRGGGYRCAQRILDDGSNGRRVRADVVWCSVFNESWRCMHRMWCSIGQRGRCSSIGQRRSWCAINSGHCHRSRSRSRWSMVEAGMRGRKKAEEEQSELKVESRVGVRGKCILREEESI